MWRGSRCRQYKESQPDLGGTPGSAGSGSGGYCTGSLPAWLRPLFTRGLSVWFALHVLFGHVVEKQAGFLRWYAFDPLALDLKASALAVIASVLAFWFHRGLIEVVVVMAALGVALRLILGA